MAPIQRFQIVIAHYRYPEGGDIYLAGPVTDITTDTVYRDDKQLYPKGTTVYMVEANEHVTVNWNGILARALTPDVIPYDSKVWQTIKHHAQEADLRFRILNRQFYTHKLPEDSPVSMEVAGNGGK